ncbi:MAG: hypothetical protein AAF481_04270 [Acidobacteriota bacterium]
MTPDDLLELYPGPFNFLRPEAEEIGDLMPDLRTFLPRPQHIFLEDEEATPILGFPVLLSPAMRRLTEALGEFLAAEEKVQVAVYQRRSFDRKVHGAAWERYRALLARVVENVSLSSYGRSFPSIFWLHHSVEIARLLKDSPRRLLRLDTEIGRRYGDSIKFRVLDRYLDFVFAETYELAHRLAGRTDSDELDLFPRLLNRFRDNVLLLTEDHIGPGLEELASYFHGCLRIDGRDLLRRLRDLAGWNEGRLQNDANLQSVVRNLLRRSPLPSNTGEPDPADRGRELLITPGYVRFLSERSDYPSRRLLDDPGVALWESLLLKLKEFEVIHTLRRFLVPVVEDQGRLVHRAEGGAGALPGRRHLVLSSATRPLDFLAPWVVEPLVQRFGLIYDLTDFSEVVAVIRRAGSGLQDESFRKIFTFQRQINALARSHRLQLEKYLGDGAFYSGRHCLSVLAGAVLIQRAYGEAVDKGLPFDRGVRIALNFGSYRLLPIGFGASGKDRYEFFGHGVVELTRLISGKSTKEIDEIQNMLVSQGYPEATVHRFFSPLLKRDVGEAERHEKKRRFYSYINSSGHLVNEGIVATDAYVEQIDSALSQAGVVKVLRAEDGRRRYVVVDLEGEPAQRIGIRHLGRAHLKGLGEEPVYEVVDGARWEGVELEETGHRSLRDAARFMTPGA